MKKFLSAIILLQCLAAGLDISARAESDGACVLKDDASAVPFDALYVGLDIELERAAAPRIPFKRVNLRDFGAVGDGVTLDTEAFAKAIAALSEAGGGHLDVPDGIWLTGPVTLADRIDLHLDRGAVVLFSPDKRLYLRENEPRCRPCISADKVTDVSISGEGVIDGNGKYWRYVKRQKVSDAEWNDYRSLGGVTDDKYWWPYELKNFPNVTDSPQAEENLRAHLMVFNRCARVLVQGVTVQNSPRFHIVPTRCEDVIIDGVSVRCPWNAQNGDGIDIGNSRRVLVTGCTVDVGDDGICMKGGTGEKGLKAGPCRDILIRGNKVFRAHGGFVVGSDTSGGMERIVVKDNVFSGTDTGVRFKSAIGRGGRMSDIFISDIVMTDIRGDAVTFACDYADISYKNNFEGEKPDAAFVPDFSGISIRRIVCRECRRGVSASGIPGFNAVHDIIVADCTFFCLDAPTAIDASTASLTLDNVRFLSY